MTVKQLMTLLEKFPVEKFPGNAEIIVGLVPCDASHGHVESVTFHADPYSFDSVVIQGEPSCSLSPR